MTELPLSYADIFSSEEKVLLIRAALETRRPSTLHSQDFYELIWVQNGQVRHHLEEVRKELREGDLVFVRPSDRHALQGRSDDALVVSVALHPELIESMGQRHPSVEGFLFWSKGRVPTQLSRDSRQLAELNQSALRLERGSRSGLEAEAFLMPLITGLIGQSEVLPPDAPAWLAAACDAARDPNVFREGAAGFARAAGKAHPHVSRTARRYLGKSPSDYVNAQRMSFAARRLTGSGDSLSEIATDCGIPNLSHFHKLFRQTYGLTPQRYRKSHQRDIIQPK